MQKSKFGCWPAAGRELPVFWPSEATFLLKALLHAPWSRNQRNSRLLGDSCFFVDTHKSYTASKTYGSAQQQ
eukprot:COSAG01_NODE_6127_length_3837_cov_3.282772_3_plen_72_part_00